MSDIKPTRDWYKWKPRHFQSDVRLLSDGAELLYRRLLDEYWISAKLVQNERILQALCKYSARKWSRYWPEIKHYFVQNGEYLIHRKMEEQLAQAVDNSEKSRHAANIRWAKQESERNANAYANADPNAMPRARKETETETETEPPISPKGKSAGADRFDEFWNVCLRKTAKERARKKWVTLKCDKKADQIIDSMVEYNKMIFQYRELKTIPYPSKWLNDKSWNETPVSEKPKPKQTHGNSYDQPPSRAQPPDASKLSNDHNRKLTDAEKANFKKLMQQAKAKIAPDRYLKLEEKPLKQKKQTDERQITNEQLIMAQLLGAAKSCYKVWFHELGESCLTEWYEAEDENNKCHWCQKFERERNGPAKPKNEKRIDGLI